jgi:Flp pilus assembly protein TadG
MIFSKLRRLVLRKTCPAPQFTVASHLKLERACRTCRRNRQGAAAVEFAVVAPVFFLMIFGMIEIGRAVMVQQIITNASREGARIAVLDSTTPTHDTVVNSVKSYLQNGGVSGSAATVTISPNEPTSAGYGQPVTVTVQIPFSSVSWLPTPIFLGSTSKLTASTVMRRETVQ